MRGSFSSGVGYESTANTTIADSSWWNRLVQLKALGGRSSTWTLQKKEEEKNKQNAEETEEMKPDDHQQDREATTDEATDTLGNVRNSPNIPDSTNNSHTGTPKKKVSLSIKTSLPKLLSMGQRRSPRRHSEVSPTTSGRFDSETALSPKSPKSDDTQEASPKLNPLRRWSMKPELNLISSKASEFGSENESNKLKAASTSIIPEKLPPPQIESYKQYFNADNMALVEEARIRRRKDLQKLVEADNTLPPRLRNIYKLTDVLGDGAYGFAMRAVNRENGIKVAIKFILKSKMAKKTSFKTPTEINLLCAISEQDYIHPNLIQYIDDDEDSNTYYLVTELWGTPWSAENPLLYDTPHPGLLPRKQTIDISDQSSSTISGGYDLFECIDHHARMPEQVIRNIMRQIASAVRYLHENNIVHRDLKDENIVIDEHYRLKLIDFGSAEIFPSDSDFDYIRTSDTPMVKAFNGTLQFAPPEVLSSEMVSYDPKKAEIWSMGNPK